MADRGGAPPLNNQVRSQDTHATQQPQVTSNHHAEYSPEMEVDSVSNQDGVNSANSGVQHLHTHPLVHRPRAQYIQDTVQPRAQPRTAPGYSRKRAYEPDYSVADIYRSAEQIEQRMGVRRLPFVGEFLQQEPHDRVHVQYNPPQYKDQLELLGGNQSSINWFAPEQRHKVNYGHQFVAKVATDDESLTALVKTIQQEARKQGSHIVNLWMQCQDSNEQRKLSKTVVGQTYNHLAPSYNATIQSCTACGKAGHRVVDCPKPDPLYFSIRMCPHLQVDPQSEGRFHIELTEAPASMAHAVGSAAPRPAPNPAPNPADAAVEEPPRGRSMPVIIKTKPDTEGSGITVPKELVKIPIEHVTVTERCMQILDDDDDEVDPADYLYRSMPPTKPHNAVIQPAQLRPQALQAAALRVARNNSLRQYGESSTANDVDPDTQMSEGDPPAGVSQSGQASEDAENAADDSPDEEIVDSDGENREFFPSQVPKKKPRRNQEDSSDEDETPK
ncbi:hypothetical protein QR685DRAFT_438015 [Neurospora intermedia]|uniref:CCHC-type domain-containing protein n=1 Tax=Neurospora intermedia TaxID=5142 RepID=A0ABR3DF68_NEUIN